MLKETAKTEKNQNERRYKMRFSDRPYLESVTIPAHKNKHHEKVSRISVPFYCMFNELDKNGNRKTERKLGEVICSEAVSDNHKQASFSLFELIDMSKQIPITEHRVNNVIARMSDITEMIKKYGINIGKVKIIFVEE